MPPDRAEADSESSGPRQSLRRPYQSAARLDALVVTLLRQSNGPLTAYEITQRAGERRDRLSPTQVYRALDRLMAEKAVERIELLSAYLPCGGEERGFLICRRCRSVLPFPLSALQVTAGHLCRTVGFRPARIICESWGVCRDCAPDRPPTG